MTKNRKKNEFFLKKNGGLSLFSFMYELICRLKKKTVNKGHSGRTVTFIEKYAKSYIVSVMS